MNCPRCLNSEIDSNDLCPVCGFRAVSGEEPLHPQSAGPPTNVTPHEAAAPDAALSEQQAELPEWRQELSRRLQEIKLKREAPDANPPAAEAAVSSETTATQVPVTSEPEPTPSEQTSPRRLRRAAHSANRDLPPATGAAPTGQLPTLPADHDEPEPQIFQPAASGLPAADVVIRPPVQEAEVHRQQDTRDLIDTVLAKLEAQKQLSTGLPEPQLAPEPKAEAKLAAEPKAEPKSTTEPKAAVRLAPEPRAEVRSGLEYDWRIPITPALPDEPRDDKLILLSRTLAGLMDLIIVVVCASLIILAVDTIEGIDLLDTVSKIHYALLYLLTYFVYSFFFLGMSGQTIGMMLTDLRIVGVPFRRLGAIQILVRCCAFLLGISALGLGLLWGCFDRRSRCFHDVLSGTNVVRITY